MAISLIWIYFPQRTTAADPPFVAPFNFPPGLKEGEQGSVTCTIRSGDRPVEFKWLKDDKEMTESSSVRIQSPGDYSILLIQSVVPESSRNYTCIVRNAYGSDRFTATLTVSAPPVWVKEPRDILAQEGDSISFDCLAEGEPKPSVKWFRGAEKSEIVSDNVIGMSISSSGSLVVSKVVYSMQDSYTCVADNGLGKPLSQTVSLSVRGYDFGDAPVVAPFVFPPAFKKGERGSVICTIRSGDRPVEFNWRKDGNTLSPSSSVDIQLIKDSSILVIESVTSKSSGNYTCVVSNAFGKDQFTATLIVTAPPQWIKEPMNTISQEGENVIIDCEASGVPPPAIKWISSNTKEQVSKDASSAVRISEAGSLIINRVEASMHGSYACEADNGFGEPLRKEILISVRDPPVVAPFIFPPALKEGERGSATCTIRSGERPVQFQWKKDGEILNENSNLDIQLMKDSSFLIIESVTSRSSGNYTCIVSNNYGRDEYTASLTVTAPPEWLKEPLDTVVQEGESVTIECQGSGVPLPTIKWTTVKLLDLKQIETIIIHAIELVIYIIGDNNAVISNDPSSPIRVSSTGSLIINKVEATMKGTYTCEAENGFGIPLKKAILIAVRVYGSIILVSYRFMFGVFNFCDGFDLKPEIEYGVKM
ncbi:cell adhesion molecule Dscam2-like [Argiope bruennichi]|uniref:cell adhesion molecule Dscam2-like n=1 Tax=Argiope bruennichi TaxID=94029 RepID=UPI0024956ADE|nr:cell adhesion molecule Dscam2-like [Argiope bruennichi]